MMDDLSRRDFVKTSVAAATAAAVGVPMVEPAAAADIEAGITWEKSVCRFCGVGCGIMVATSGGRIVSVKGDPESPVNRLHELFERYARRPSVSRREPTGRAPTRRLGWSAGGASGVAGARGGPTCRSARRLPGVLVRGRPIAKADRGVRAVAERHAARPPTTTERAAVAFTRLTGFQSLAWPLILMFATFRSRTSEQQYERRFFHGRDRIPRRANR